MCGKGLGSTERLAAMVPIRGVRGECDPCLLPMVQALVDAGMPTIASCCGHGRVLGRVTLADGRELLIAPDFETATRLWVRL